MAALDLRPCSMADLEVLTRLARQTFEEAFAPFNTPVNTQHYLDNQLSVGKLRQELLSKESAFYLAFVEDQLVGYLKVNQAGAQTDLNDPDSLELERIYILSQFQNKGLGLILLQKAINLAREVRMKFIWLGVWDQNHGAIRFYERHGFVITGAHEFRFGDEQQTDYIMRLDLA